jgi:uncharacterized membrane protein
MAKKNNNSKTEPKRAKSAHKGPVLTHAAYKTTLVVLVLGLIAQLVMAFIVYPTLPAQIPSGWTGSAQPYNHVSKSMVFVLFPGFELVTLLIAFFSPKDAEARRVMTSGNAVTFILLALVFTALESSAFFIRQ